MFKICGQNDQQIKLEKKIWRMIKKINFKYFYSPHEVTWIQIKNLSDKLNNYNDRIDMMRKGII